MPSLARAPVLFLVLFHNVRIRAVRRLWLRFWHPLLAAVLAALILYAFKVVFRGHFDRTCDCSSFANARRRSRVPRKLVRNVPDISLFAPSQANGRLLSRKKPFTSMLAFATPNVPKDLSMPKAALVSLATSVPPHVFLQKDVLAAAWDVFGPRFPEFDRFSSIFSNTGIIKRHAVKPFDWYLESRGWPERTAAFLSGAEELFVEVAEKALADAHLTGAEIDTVVTVCSTGIATPSLEARVSRPSRQCRSRR